jgi:uncharacterized membrane protein
MFTLTRVTEVFSAVFGAVIFIGVPFAAAEPPSTAAQTTPDTFRVSEPYIITAPDGGRTQVRAINIQGQVVGVHGPIITPQPALPVYALYSGWQLEPGGSHSFVWSREKGFKDLGVLTVAAINDCGDIAGSLTSNGAYHAFRKVGDEVQDLGTLEPNNPNAWSVAMGINERGDVVGVASVTQPALGFEIYVGFLWTEANGMVPVHDPALFGGAFGINNRRQISGFRQGSVESALGGARIWDSDGSILGNAGLGGRYGAAMAINSRTQAVGTAATGYQFGPLVNGFFWSPTTGTIELYPGGATGFSMDFGSEPHDIDDRGRIVGVINMAMESGVDPVRSAAVWTSPTEYFVLTEQSSDAVGINNRGDVIGHLFNRENNTQQGVVWQVHTPTDKSIFDAAYSTLTGLAICRLRKRGK